MPTREEFSEERDLSFSKWIRKTLPDSSTGFLVSDIDFVLKNTKKKNVMVLEVKTRGGVLRDWQRIFYTNLSRWIENGIDGGWTYLGAHLLVFENTSPEDGKIYLNGHEISEEQLIGFLTMS